MCIRDRITVERPLRLRYAGGTEARERLEASKAFAKLNEEQREGLLGIVTALGELSTTDRAEALAAAAAVNGKLSKAEEKALLEAFAVRDPEAPSLTEPDPELRDQENVPLQTKQRQFEPDVSQVLTSEAHRQAIAQYMEGDVLPYASDAWVDHSKTKIGYQIPLTRHFYRYRPPRVLEQIDSEVRGLQKRIDDLLRESETCSALMADAVRGRITGGKPAPSSLPWLDERRSHWREAKLTLLARLGSGHTPSRERQDWWENCTIPWITTGDISQMRGDREEFITETKYLISEAGLANSAAELHPAGTVVLSRTASVGFSMIMGKAMATSQDFATWTCGDLLRPRFLLLCLRVMRGDLLGRLAMGSTHKTIYMPDIESIRVPLPSPVEQDTIVEAVWQALRPIDEATGAVEQQLSLLIARREALMAAALTGETAGSNT